MPHQSEPFELRGLNHVAMVCRDMQRTVDFYTNVLDMKLVKTIDLPGGLGQHFFFAMGGGRQCLAFFWFTEAQDRVPGVSNPRENIDPQKIFDDPTSLASSHGSMNHIAFDIAPEKIEEYRKRLIERGIEVTSVMHHDNSPNQAAPEVTDNVWVSSIYFQDPDGILLEFAAWQRPFSAEKGDRIDHRPATPDDIPRYRAAARS